MLRAFPFAVSRYTAVTDIAFAPDSDTTFSIVRQRIGKDGRNRGNSIDVRIVDKLDRRDTGWAERGPRLNILDIKVGIPFCDTNKITGWVALVQWCTDWVALTNQGIVWLPIFIDVVKEGLSNMVGDDV